MAKVIKRFWDGNEGPLYREGDIYPSPDTDRAKELIKLGYLKEEEDVQEIQHRRKAKAKEPKTEDSNHQ